MRKEIMYLQPADCQARNSEINWAAMAKYEAERWPLAEKGRGQVDLLVVLIYIAVWCDPNPMEKIIHGTDG